MDSMYVQMVEVIKNWDPFGYGPEFYETEAVDVIQIVEAFDDAAYIAKKIQHVYFMSCDEVVDIKKCRQLAEQLVSMKEMGSCR